MKEIRLKRNQIYNCVQTLFFFTYVVLGSLVSIAIPNTYLRVGIEWVGFVVLFILGRGARIRITHKEIKLIPFFLVVICGYFNSSPSAIFELTIMIPFLLLVIVLKERMGLIPVMYTVLQRVDLFYAFATIFLSCCRTIYVKLAQTLFPAQFERLIEWYDHGYMAGLTSHYSINGILLVTGTILTYCRLPYLQKRRDKYKCWGELIIFVIAVLLTGKRGVTIFGLISIFTGYYLTLASKRRNRLICVMKYGLVVLCGIATLMIAIPALNGIAARFSETIQQGDVTLGRVKYWRLAFENFCRHPFVGIGWGNFGEIAEQVYGKNTEAHNVYIQLLCETGIVGMSAFLLFAISILRQAISKFTKWTIQERHNTENGIWLLFSCCYQMFFLLYCLSGTPLYSPTAYMPYFFACGIALIDVEEHTGYNWGEATESCELEY